jgi:hypothetical protein
LAQSNATSIVPTLNSSATDWTELTDKGTDKKKKNVRAFVRRIRQVRS